MENLSDKIDKELERILKLVMKEMDAYGFYAPEEEVPQVTPQQIPQQEVM